MYFLVINLILPMINALLTVQIHRNSRYNASAPCAFIRNASWPQGASIQSCIWECNAEYDCQTAIYFDDENICSMFSEFCKIGTIVSSGNIRANVICNRKNQNPVATCSSTTTGEMATTEQTTTTTTTTTSTTSTTTSSTTTNSTAAITANPCTSGNLLWNTTGITVLGSSPPIAASGVYVDANDTLYAVDENSNYVVWKLLKNAVNATIIAGIKGSAGSNSTQLNYPNDVYADRNGDVYVCDSFNYRVQKFINGSANGITIANITNPVGSSLSSSNIPRYLTFDSNDTYFYIADYYNNRIMRYLTNSTSGTNGTLVAGGTGANNTNTSLNLPWGIHYLPSVSNDLFITNYGGHSVMRWTPGASSGVFVAGTPGVPGSTSTLLDSPMGIKIDTYLNMYVVDNNNNRVQMFCANNQTGITIVGTGSAGNSATQLSWPRGIAFDSAMNMYIGDTGNKRVQKFLKL